MSLARWLCRLSPFSLWYSSMIRWMASRLYPCCWQSGASFPIFISIIWMMPSPRKVRLMSLSMEGLKWRFVDCLNTKSKLITVM
uniref:Uncharacterized protein n=1 Tax=Rhizophora mucronata TaxID=61149 RepID=A0A2P2PA41_RHIMU